MNNPEFLNHSDAELAAYGSSLAERIKANGCTDGDLARLLEVIDELDLRMNRS